MTLATICDDKLAQLDAILKDNSRAYYHPHAMTVQRAFRTIRDNNDTSPEGAGELLKALHEFQRVSFGYHADLKGDKTYDYYDALKLEPSWGDLPVLDVEPALREKLAGQLLHSNLQHIEGGSFDAFDPGLPPRRKGKTLLRFSASARGVAEHIVSYMLRHDAPFEVDFTDPMSKKALYERCDEEQMARIVAFNSTRYEGVNNRLSVISYPPLSFAEKTGLDPDDKKRRAFAAPIDALDARMKAGTGFYTVTILPTEQEAALDGMDYKGYLKLFFEACDQPWAAIQRAQGHLIEKLNAASSVHIVDEDTGTDLRMRIDGKRWANSLTLKNIPGSEVFASATRDSVNGTLVSYGKFKPAVIGGLVKDIRLNFRDGRVEEFDAAEGKEHLERFLHMDDGRGEGSRYTGELAFGTNPWLKKHMTNGLLVEKISSSFHLALGGAYSNTSYDGQPVALDNGNVSASDMHWDITTMMKGPRSRIVLDEGTPNEYVVMQAGMYPDPALRVLNEGWAALPKDQQPNYWQERLKVPAYQPSPTLGK